MASETVPSVPEDPELPEGVGVSLITCILNEERHIEAAVAHALDQDYAGPLELVVALGPSKDGTDAIVARLAAADPRVRCVRNPSPSGATPSGLNAAIALTKHPVIVRIDGHCLLPPEYVRTAVGTMRRTGADNVGGIMAAEGVSVFEQSVARAMTSRLGVGNAAFHTGGEEGEALTVYLGVFRRSALERVGGFDEAFLRAQDWEMNLRIRRTGGKVWFTPALKVAYRPRPGLRALSRQYFHYGRWRRVITRRHPDTVSVRYLAPPVALLGFVAGAVVAPFWWPAALVPAGYAAALVAGSAAEGRGLPAGAWLRLPLVLATMHFSWGLGFLTSPRKLAAEAAAAQGHASEADPDVVPEVRPVGSRVRRAKA
jgi:succinoglycan biosynthesis protein ExoA